jgi:hypothetical protein
VNDGPGADIDIQGSQTTIAANWTGFSDSGCGLAGYQWAIGTSPGGQQVQLFTNVGTATGATASGLSLIRGTKYFVSIKATDNLGNVGNTASSNGVTVETPSPVLTGYSVDSGIIGDGITNDNTPTLAGTAEASSTIEIFDGLNPIGSTTTDIVGNWQFTTGILPNGLHHFTATATDAGGHKSPASAALDVVVDNASPSVTVNQASGQAEPTSLSPIAFAVHFSEPVTGFSATGIDFSGSTVTGSMVQSIVGSGADYTLSVIGMSGQGNVVASVLAGAAIDVAGNSNTASTSTDNSVAFDNVAPTVTINQDARPG